MSDALTQSSEGGGHDTAEPVIQPMRLADIDEVALMEQVIFPSPWPRQAFANELKEGSASLCLVARVRDRLAGYLVAWFVLDEAHVGNVAVAPEFREKGIATGLTNRLIREAQARGVRLMTLEVRVSNLPAIRLYRRLGFKTISMRRRYYADNGEDAFVMLLEMSPPRGPVRGRAGPQ
ncbi:MAG: ribosomal protein S18-alanine N-acetyltransferase [Candidatus Eiseniibacteriota bacterium]|nr:MAG: ribosomal protein S18-alanine N-acetyltransferase [Candidatus Eisenbacteria bacterium]